MFDPTSVLLPRVRLRLVQEVIMVTLTDAEAERLAVILEDAVLETPNGRLPEGVRPDAQMFADELRVRQEDN